MRGLRHLHEDVPDRRDKYAVGGIEVDMDEYLDKIKSMDKDELKEELELLEESLEDIQIERRLILGQTGVHINAGKIEAYRNSFDREISNLETKISHVKGALQA